MLHLHEKQQKPTTETMALVKIYRDISMPFTEAIHNMN